MEAGNGAERVRRQGAQVLHGVAHHGVQLEAAAHLHHGRVEVDAAGRQAVVAEQLQPLAAAAAHVQHRTLRGAGAALVEQRQVGRLALPDERARAAELVLEGEVQIVERMVVAAPVAPGGEPREALGGRVRGGLGGVQPVGEGHQRVVREAVARLLPGFRMADGGAEAGQRRFELAHARAGLGLGVRARAAFVLRGGGRLDEVLGPGRGRHEGLFEPLQVAQQARQSRHGGADPHQPPDHRHAAGAAEQHARLEADHLAPDGLAFVAEADPAQDLELGLPPFQQRGRVEGRALVGLAAEQLEVGLPDKGRALEGDQGGGVERRGHVAGVLLLLRGGALGTAPGGAKPDGAASAAPDGPDRDATAWSSSAVRSISTTRSDGCRSGTAAGHRTGAAVAGVSGEAVSPGSAAAAAVAGGAKAGRVPSFKAAPAAP